MSRQRPEVNKIDFFEIFSPNYNSKKMQVGICSEVFVTIHSKKFSYMDQAFFKAILVYGNKSEVDDMIVSVVNTEKLLTYLPESDISLENALYRLSSVRLEVIYSQNNERHEEYYNIFDLAMSSDASGNSVAITLGIKSLDVLEWLFKEDLIKLLKSFIEN
jgi:hypothetical protein